MNKYIPNAPRAWDKIAIFHTLTHTSGIPNFTSFPDYPEIEGRTVAPEQLVARSCDKPLDFAHGRADGRRTKPYGLLLG